MPVLDDLPHVLRPAAAEPAGAIVLLHGLGATEQDPAALLEVLDPQRRLVAACPQGTMTVPGSIGFMWYVDREPGYPQRDTFEQTYEILGTWLDALCASTGVPLERTIIGGFSQGATVAWALALGARRPRPGALLAVSGFVPRVSDLELSDDNLRDLPVAICHGAQDTRVPVALAQSARDRATEGGAQVLYRETDVPHILDPRVVPDLIGWVGERFA
jgi:phospholipase/carboxylesterase